MFRAISFEIIKFCFSLVSFSYTFRLLMFIEAGDVTHRRRGQNRNEEFRDFSYFFFHQNIYLHGTCVIKGSHTRQF